LAAELRLAPKPAPVAAPVLDGDFKVSDLLALLMANPDATLADLIKGKSTAQVEIAPEPVDEIAPAPAPAQPEIVIAKTVKKAALTTEDEALWS
jgi:hypothetical protein